MAPKIDVNFFKRAQRGLYAGKQRLTGHHVSPSKRQCVVVVGRRCVSVCLSVPLRAAALAHNNPRSPPPLPLPAA